MDNHVRATSAPTKIGISSFVKSKPSLSKKVLQKSPVSLLTERGILLMYKGKRAWATEMAVVVMQQDEEKYLKSCFLASSACSLLMFTPRSPAQPCQRFRGFSFQQEAFQNVIKCHRKQGGREKIADIKQDAHWHNALLQQPEVSVFWSCFYCDPSKFMYALCIFRSLYTFDILFLFFEL